MITQARCICIVGAFLGFSFPPLAQAHIHFFSDVFHKVEHGFKDVGEGIATGATKATKGFREEVEKISGDVNKEVKHIEFGISNIKPKTFLHDAFKLAEAAGQVGVKLIQTSGMIAQAGVAVDMKFMQQLKMVSPPPQGTLIPGGVPAGTPGAPSGGIPDQGPGPTGVIAGVTTDGSGKVVDTAGYVIGILDQQSMTIRLVENYPVPVYGDPGKTQMVFNQNRQYVGGTVH